MFLGWAILLWCMLPTTLAQFSSPLVSPTLSSSPAAATAVPTTFTTAPSSTGFLLGNDPITSTSHSDNAPDTTSSPNSQNGSAGDSDDSSDQKSGLLNYYFVFLAFFILILFIGAWFLHKRKQARKARFRNSGQNALARDLGNWTNTRRWMHGNIRTDPATQNRNEGLNELGEAPPPYKAPETAGPPGEGPQIPLRTLSRSSANMPVKPPDYGEVLRASRTVEDDNRPSTAFPGGESDGSLMRTQPGRP
jgi:hypothetical protein